VVDCAHKSHDHGVLVESVRTTPLKATGFSPSA
jgi:hypothetical protein